MMLKLLYLLLISDTLLLASEGGSISVTSSGGESLEKWSVGRCILVSMHAKIFIRTKVKQSQKKVENWDKDQTIPSLTLFDLLNPEQTRQTIQWLWLLHPLLEFALMALVMLKTPGPILQSMMRTFWRNFKVLFRQRLELYWQENDLGRKISFDFVRNRTDQLYGVERVNAVYETRKYKRAADSEMVTEFVSCLFVIPFSIQQQRWVWQLSWWSHGSSSSQLAALTFVKMLAPRIFTLSLGNIGN